MKTAIFGGSFNPPHNGHVHLIETVKEHTDYQRIFLIPLHTPSHKEVSVHVDTSHRVEMVRLLADFCCPACRLETLEIERGGVSYTWDTVRELYKKYDDITGRLGIVIGDDLLEGLADWYEIEQMKELVEFTVLCRDLSEQRNRDFERAYRERGIIVHLIPEDTVEISSSRIRSSIRKGESVEGLLPLPILRYIDSHGLYRD
jgi:nicotinate-nucleotide adenylyltransferase